VVSIWLLSSPSLMWSFFIGRATAEIYTLSLHDALPIFGLESSGNVLGVLSDVLKLETSAEGERLLFGVPYLQFAKTEIDYRWYRHLGGNKQFVLRFNGGVAVPYGNNSRLLIFEKSFFGGGMNGIRAWQARTLGPGNYNRADLPERLRLNLRNLDQLGELKLEANAEYRFR